MILLRGDLKLSPGKACAQAAHVAVKAALIAEDISPEIFKAWDDGGFKKVVLRVSSEQQLNKLFESAINNAIPAFLVRDAGLTELPPNTATAAGIGPALATDIDKITSDLKPYYDGVAKLHCPMCGKKVPEEDEEEDHRRLIAFTRISCQKCGNITRVTVEAVEKDEPERDDFYGANADSSGAPS